MMVHVQLEHNVWNGEVLLEGSVVMEYPLC